MTDVKRTATTKQVAGSLGVKETTVQLYSREGRIPFDRTPGGHRRYNLDEVRSALDMDDQPSLLTSMARTSGLGAGATFHRSAMATMDAERRAIVGEATATDDEQMEPAVLTLIGHSPRVLVAV